jgi:hypothetical protein
VGIICVQYDKKELMVGPAESALDGRIRQPGTVATWGEAPPGPPAPYGRPC